ncbi:ribonuclease domain-containing protein [Virgibacillus kimchii]
MKRFLYMLIVLFAAVLVAGCNPEAPITEENTQEITEVEINEEGHYTSKEEVALYIHTYNRLPDNYITKEEAHNMGWEPSEGNLWEVTDQKSIGGDSFGNREGKLPDEEGRKYFAADIHYEGGYRGPERIVYSDDGFIYYTPDHYDTFVLLYGDE